MKDFFKRTKSKSKKTVTAIYIVAILALSPLTMQLAYSKEDPKSSVKKSYPMTKNIIKIIDQLHLSPEQNKKIQKSLISNQKDYMNLTSNINITKNQLLNLSTNTSGEQLKALAQTQSENINKLIQLKTKVRQEIFSALDPQQTKLLNEKWKKFQKEQIDNIPQSNTDENKINNENLEKNTK